MGVHMDIYHVHNQNDMGNLVLYFQVGSKIREHHFDKNLNGFYIPILFEFLNYIIKLQI